MAAAILGLAVTIAGASPADANPMETFGFGSRAIAMGGAYSALAEDSAAAYYNPAGLTGSEDIHLTVGYSFYQPFLRIDGIDNDVTPIEGTNFGLSLSFPVPRLGRRVGLGFAGYYPSQWFMRFQVLPQQKPRFELVGNRSQRIVYIPSFAVEVIPATLSIGAGVFILGNNLGGVEVDIAQEGTNEITVGKVKNTITENLAPIAGILYTPTESLRFSLAYRGKQANKLVLPQDITLLPLTVYGIPDLVGATTITLDIVSMNFFQPQQLALGCAYRLGRVATVSFDFTWLQWSAFESSAPSVVTKIVGGLANVLPQVMDSVVLEPHFHDTFVPAVGVEAPVLHSTHLDVALRGGYLFRPSPVPDQKGGTNFIDLDAHVLSAGAGFRLKDFSEILPRGLAVDLHFQSQIMSERGVVKRSLADPVGDYRADGEILGGGITLTLDL